MRMVMHIFISMSRLKKYLLCVLIISASLKILFEFCTLNQQLNGKEDSTMDVDFSKFQNLKKILVWHHAFGDKSLYFGFGHKPFLKSCKENRCFLTSNRNLVNFENFDAIIFHFRNLNLRKMPSSRFAHQRWIFYESEPASYLMNNLRWYNNFFNWTMTYRKDSDVILSSGFFINKTLHGNETNKEDYPEGKEHLVSWVASHCPTHSWREKLVEVLQKYIPVSIYGKCGNLSCPIDEDCFAMIERKFKFYLAFENSLCKDYVTEKLYRSLRMNIVPIVYGAVDYSKISPKHSYINVENFSTMKDLAKYLQYLDKNNTAYYEYFQWKQKYRIALPSASRDKAFCDLCLKLHQDDQPKTYNDIHSWFTKDQCKRNLPYSFWDHFSSLIERYYYLPLF